MRLLVVNNIVVESVLLLATLYVTRVNGEAFHNTHLPYSCRKHSGSLNDTCRRMFETNSDTFANYDALPGHCLFTTSSNSHTVCYEDCVTEESPYHRSILMHMPYRVLLATRARS